MGETKKRVKRTRKKKVVKYILDYSKIKTVKDVIMVIKSLNPTYIYTEGTPSTFEEIFDKGLLIEIGK